jgi:hypothetical protein
LRRKNTTPFIKEAHMNSIADGSVIIQTSSKSVLSTPSWFGEATLIVEHLRKQGVLSAIRERVRFTTLKELRQALAAVGRYLATHQLQQERSLIRLDGHYGTGAVLTAPFWVRVCDPWQRLQKEEPRRRHACRHRLRTLLHQPATTSVHRGFTRRVSMDNYVPCLLTIVSGYTKNSNVFWKTIFCQGSSLRNGQMFNPKDWSNWNKCVLAHLQVIWLGQISRSEKRKGNF